MKINDETAETDEINAKDFEELMKKLEEDSANSTFLEKVSFEVSYFFRNLRGNIRGFFVGLSNFWRFRSEIYHYRWWDYAFLHDTLKARLTFMRDSWDDSHYVTYKKEKETLIELVELLDEIERLEDNFTLKSESMIDQKYQEFGRKLFDIIEYTEEYEGKEYTKRFSSIRRFWD